MNIKELQGLIAKEGKRKEFNYKGMHCIILRPHDEIIHLCGYVCLPKEHKLHGLYYDDIYKYVDIKVHGGLTYSERGGNVVHQNKEDWVIGFDCAHLGDLAVLSSHYGITHTVLKDTYRDMDFVEQELQNLVDQIQSMKDCIVLPTLKIDE